SSTVGIIALTRHSLFNTRPKPFSTSAMTATNKSKPGLDVAIIGGGPAGLAAAIELEKLPFVRWRLYEKKPRISETGGGISIQRNTWRMLEVLGVAKNIHARDFFRPHDGHSVQHRSFKLVGSW